MLIYTLFAGILFAVLAVENYQELQMHRRSGYHDDRPPWAR